MEVLGALVQMRLVPVHAILDTLAPNVTNVQQAHMRVRHPIVQVCDHEISRFLLPL